MARWFGDHDKLVEFANVLNDNEEFEGPSEVIYYFENAHEWDQEHKAWVEVGEPIDADDKGWDAFGEFLGERESGDEE